MYSEDLVRRQQSTRRYGYRYPRSISSLVIGLGIIALFATSSFARALKETEVSKVLRNERFQLLHHIRDISAEDWSMAGVTQRGRPITATMANPGEAYERFDVYTGDLPLRQLFIVAKNPRYEVLCFWQGTEGGPMLRVIMLQRDRGKSAIAFYAIMNNDIPRDKWTWDQIKQHIRHSKIDVIISAEHPGSYDTRSP